MESTGNTLHPTTPAVPASSYEKQPGFAERFSNWWNGNKSVNTPSSSDINPNPATPSLDDKSEGLNEATVVASTAETSLDEAVSTQGSNKDFQHYKDPDNHNLTIVTPKNFTAQIAALKKIFSSTCQVLKEGGSLTKEAVIFLPKLAFESHDDAPVVKALLTTGATVVSVGIGSASIGLAGAAVGVGAGLATLYVATRLLVAAGAMGLRLSGHLLGSMLRLIGTMALTLTTLGHQGLQGTVDAVLASLFNLDVEQRRTLLARISIFTAPIFAIPAAVSLGFLIAGEELARGPKAHTTLLTESRITKFMEAAVGYPSRSYQRNNLPPADYLKIITEDVVNIQKDLVSISTTLKTHGPNRGAMTKGDRHLYFSNKPPFFVNLEQKKAHLEQDLLSRQADILKFGKEHYPKVVEMAKASIAKLNAKIAELDTKLKKKLDPVEKKHLEHKKEILVQEGSKAQSILDFCKQAVIDINKALPIADQVATDKSLLADRITAYDKEIDKIESRKTDETALAKLQKTEKELQEKIAEKIASLSGRVTLPKTEVINDNLPIDDTNEDDDDDSNFGDFKTISTPSSLPPLRPAPPQKSSDLEKQELSSGLKDPLSPSSHSYDELEDWMQEFLAPTNNDSSSANQSPNATDTESSSESGDEPAMPLSKSQNTESIKSEDIGDFNTISPPPPPRQPPPPPPRQKNPESSSVNTQSVQANTSTKTVKKITSKVESSDLEKPELSSELKDPLPRSTPSLAELEARFQALQVPTNNDSSSANQSPNATDTESSSESGDELVRTSVNQNQPAAPKSAENQLLFEDDESMSTLSSQTKETAKLGNSFSTNTPFTEKTAPQKSPPPTQSVSDTTNMKKNSSHYSQKQKKALKSRAEQLIKSCENDLLFKGRSDSIKQALDAITGRSLDAVESQRRWKALEDAICLVEQSDKS